MTSVQCSTGLLTGEVIIFASGNKAQIQSTVKAHTRPFVDDLRIQLEAAKKPSGADDRSHPSTGTLSELEKLASLKERGLLSDEEFSAAKRKVLGI